MRKIDGDARTVRQLLDGVKYAIDFYQREYAWQEPQVQELIDDLTGKFLNSYSPEHERPDVERYGHYFLGSIVISHKRKRKYVVDGQQRLTTLSLLLIYLHHLQADREVEVPVANLVFSEKYGKRSFNLDVPERTPCMEALFQGETFDAQDASESVRNLVGRYQDIGTHLPDLVAGEALPFFIDWLLENVHLVEIEAYSDEDAYTIFETMNDRGLSLSLPEMLKGYVLANITDEDEQRRVNDSWKKRVQALRERGEAEDAHFFKHWLRARHASSIRPGQKGAQNMDFERIGSEFHRWVRDKRESLGLSKSSDFVRFVVRDVDFFARQYLRLLDAASSYSDELPSVYFNGQRGFTHQYMLLLAALDPDDEPKVVTRKIQLVSDYLDIWLARRVWNFRTIAYSSVKYTMFNLAKDLRDLDLSALAELLREQAEAEEETFESNTRLRVHQQNFRQVRHILARLTWFVDEGCGVGTSIEHYLSQGRGRPFEVEHIWPDHFDRFSDVFDHPTDFDQYRNRVGGLLLLPRGINQSLNDSDYELKRDAYAQQNLLAASLHPQTYKNNPAFRRFIEKYDLPVRAYDDFGKKQLKKRQFLYRRLAEAIWSTDRLSVETGA